MKDLRLATFSAVAIALTAAPVHAQQDSVRLRTASTVPAQIERLARELDTQRRAQNELSRAYEEIRASLAKEPDESERVAKAVAARRLFEEMRVANAEQTRLRRELQELCSSEQPDGYLGVVLQGRATVTSSDSGPDVVTYGGRQVVASVEPGSPAAKSGIRTGDVIIALGGHEIRAGDEGATSLLRPGARLPVKLERDGDTRIVVVRIEPRPETFRMTCPWMDATIASAMTPSTGEIFYQFSTADSGDTAWRSVVVSPAPRAAAATPRGARIPVPAPAQPSVYAGPFVAQFAYGTNVVAGAQLVVMNEGLGKIFGVNEGLLVLKVLPGMTAKSSGLHEGDVLLTANGQMLSSPRVLQRVMDLAEMRKVREVKLTIVRKKDRQTLTMKW